MEFYYSPMSVLLNEAWWWIYALVNWVIIGWDNGLSPGHHQPIIWTHDNILSIRPKEIYLNEISFEIQKLSLKNASENIAYVMAAFSLGLNLLNTR